MIKNIKSALLYVLIVACGIGVGRLAMQVPKWLTPAYVEGNFANYFPDATTKVVVYGTQTCPFCMQTRAYLKDHHIAFADIDITQPGKGMADYDSFHVHSVPLILIGNRRIIGFDKPVIEAALSNAQLHAASQTTPSRQR
ncbi:glutaredoxin family protein [Duganella sp. Dugasp56]|uniref:glutaredoxin family protein n=1 Tax=Duganella sp. Dugasp56 TaxID=3243046 RepID=UPI0039AF7628